MVTTTAAIDFLDKLNLYADDKARIRQAWARWGSAPDDFDVEAFMTEMDAAKAKREAIHE
jgi:hypothetical protein